MRESRRGGGRGERRGEGERGVGGKEREGGRKGERGDRRGNGMVKGGCQRTRERE